MRADFRAWLADALPQFLRALRLWGIGLLVGVLAGLTAIVFRKGVAVLQELSYGRSDTSMLHSHAQGLPWFVLLAVPILGGLIVGIILHVFTPDGRARSIADVIEGAHLDQGRVEHRAGLASFFASMVTLGMGGSSGREGPLVHIAAVISSWVSERLRADGITARDLLGCAAAGAVSASFNAPIAGAIFALEVVLRHFAVHAFGPIVIASAAGTVISRLQFGELTEFVLPIMNTLEFYNELPAFLILGLVCALVAVALMQSIFLTDRVASRLQNRLGIPRWLRPAMAGVLLGIIAIPFPAIIGVGYETTSNALSGRLGLAETLLFAVVKVAAVAITLGGRMGGGVFSPSLMLGALTGLAFGLIATAVFPDVSGASSTYALAGMGAVSAAVLGAPISTILIVFEMTGDWQVGLAVMVAVSTSVALCSRLVDRSFFLTQLERRNIHLAAGPQAYLLGMFRINRLMKPVADEAMTDAAWDLIEAGVYVDLTATLETALPLFERTQAGFLPVIALTQEGDAPALQGVLYHVDALKTYNRALAAVSAEEHG